MKFIFNRKHSLVISIVILMLFSCEICFAQDRTATPVNTVDPVNTDKACKKIANTVCYPVVFYKKHLSCVDGNRCPMYPSCSSYCLKAFSKHGLLMGWIMTCDRLMRCGGNELKLSSPIIIKGEKLCNDSVENNDFWW